MHENFAELFKKAKWKFFAATDEYKFLTSDNPMTLFN
jgi:hypothetical protein